MKLFALASLALLAALASAAYVPLEDEPLYCSRYGIEEYCSESGYDELREMTASGNLTDFFVNELAFEDSLRYSGPLEIESVNVVADLSGAADVTAVYILKNTGDSTSTFRIRALDLPEGATLREDTGLITADLLLDGWNSTFAPGQEKEWIIRFSEPLYGDVFGYNVNLIVNGSTPDNHVAPAGSFEFVLPEGAESVECSPEGYSSAAQGNRTKVVWQKTDFVPWTNPFDDLVCVWESPELALPGELAGGEPAEEAEGADNNLLIIVLVIVLVLAAGYWLRERGKPEKE